jgi:hypothetical protein
MRLRDDGQQRRGVVRPPSPPSGRHRRTEVGAALFVLLAVGLAGCGLGDGPGSLFVDPGRDAAYHCSDLAARWKVLLDREKDLRNLMDRANQGGGGAVIGSLAYGTDYDSVLAEKKIVQREATEKKCELTPVFQSDQTIR